MERERHLTTAELAEREHVQPQTVRLWRCLARGPKYIRLGGRFGRVVYRLSDVVEWEKQSLFTSTSEESARQQMSGEG